MHYRDLDIPNNHDVNFKSKLEI